MYTRYRVHAVFYVRNGSDTPGFMNSQESSAVVISYLSWKFDDTASKLTIDCRNNYCACAWICARLLSLTWHNSITTWSNDLSSCSSRWFFIYVGYKIRLAWNSWTRTFAGSSKPRSVNRSSEQICPDECGFTDSRLHSMPLRITLISNRESSMMQ